MNTAARVHERPLSGRRRPTGFVDRHIAYVLIGPTVVCMLIVNLYPLLDAVVVSFQRYTLNTPKPTFIGMENYREVVTDPSIWWAVGRSVELTALTVAISFAIGLVLALILNKPFPGRSIIRSLFIIPWAMPAFVAALVWGWMYNDQFGILSALAKQIGIASPPTWLDRDHAFWSLTAVMIWKSFPFQLVILMAGLQTIPLELYEAASIDGAAILQRFRRITVPLLRPVAMISILLAAINAFQYFVIPWLLTGGGPAQATYVLPVAVFLVAFQSGNLGYGEAAAILMFLFMLLGALVYLYYYLHEVSEL